MQSKHDPSSGSSEEEEEAEEEEEPQPTPKVTSNSIPSNDDGAESEDSDEEEDEEEPTLPLKPPSEPNESELKFDSPKPISSKPFSSSSLIPIVMGLASISKKRPADSDPKDSSRNDKKKKTKQPAGDDGDKKKKTNMFVRIWTEEDEIVILKGVIKFKKKGLDTTSNASAFYNKIKDEFSTKHVSQSKLLAKIRSLKRKFHSALKNPKPVEKLTIHDAELYRLSRKIWSEEEEEKSKSNVAAAASTNPRVTILPNSTITKAKKEVVKDVDNSSSTKYLYLTESFNASKFPVMPVPPPWFSEIVTKKGWEVIGSSKARMFDQRWKDVIVAETKANSQRLDLVKEQTQTMLDALESSDV